MATLLDTLNEKRILVSDGGWGSFLFARGLKPGDCPELWNLEHPEEVRTIARMYAEAGADIVLTNSFGGTALNLAQYGLAERCVEINRSAARLSREGAGADVLVLASIGPSGKMLLMGDISETELYDSFAEQALALAAGGADAIIVETMTALDEAGLAVKAVHENTQLDIVASLTFMDTPHGYRTMMGVSLEEMVPAMLEEGAALLGVNCTLGSKEMVPLLGELHALSPDTPILVHPNAGQPQYQSDGSVYYPETPEEMGAATADLIAAGASIIGGCCGTGPDHIRAIRAAVDLSLNQ
ncbi:MAG: homocysteine S-methyltransferase family protein [Candidatus Hydrogenedentales bacterium]|jgi:5-methyltetrahydrofolate--homocysteine methyltransferase